MYTNDGKPNNKSTNDNAQELRSLQKLQIPPLPCPVISSLVPIAHIMETNVKKKDTFLKI